MEQYIDQKQKDLIMKNVIEGRIYCLTNQLEIMKAKSITTTGCFNEADYLRVCREKVNACILKELSAQIESEI